MALTPEEKQRLIDLADELGEDVSDVVPELAPKEPPSPRAQAALRSATRSPGVRGFGEAIGEEILAPLASGASKTATLGFGDEAAGTINALIDKGWNVKGADILKNWYEQKKAQERAAAISPKIEFMGQMGGGAAVPAKGALQNAIQAGATAAGEELNPVGPALLAAGVTKGAGALGKLLGGAGRVAVGAAEGQTIPEALRQSAGEHAMKVMEVRAPMLKGMSGDEAAEIGEIALREKIVPWALPNTGTMLKRAKGLAEKSGSEYGSLLDAIEGQPFDPRAVAGKIEGNESLRKILTEPIGETGAGRTQLANVINQIKEKSPFERIEKTVFDPETYTYMQERQSDIPKTILRRPFTPPEGAEMLPYEIPEYTQKITPDRVIPSWEQREITELFPRKTTEIRPRNMTMREAQALKQDIGQMANFEAGPGVNRRPAQQAYGIVKGEMDEIAEKSLPPEDFARYMEAKKTYGAAQSMQKGLDKAALRDATTTVEFGGLGEGVKRKTMENVVHPAMARLQYAVANAADNPKAQQIARALTAAAQRGTQSLAATDYVMQQTDPAYREFMDLMDTGPREAQ